MSNRYFYDNGNGDQIGNEKITKFSEYELEKPCEFALGEIDKYLVSAAR